MKTSSFFFSSDINSEIFQKFRIYHLKKMILTRKLKNDTCMYIEITLIVKCYQIIYKNVMSNKYIPTIHLDIQQLTILRKYYLASRICLNVTLLPLDKDRVWKDPAKTQEEVLQLEPSIPSTILVYFDLNRLKRDHPFY